MLTRTKDGNFAYQTEDEKSDFAKESFIYDSLSLGCDSAWRLLLVFMGMSIIPALTGGKILRKVATGEEREDAWTTEDVSRRGLQ